MRNSAIHEDLARTEEIRGASDRSFGLVFTGIFLLLAVWPLVHRGPMRVWALALAAVFLVFSLVWPGALTPLNRLWLRFGRLLQHIVTPVVLGLLYFLVVVPIGLLMRFFGKNPLCLGFDREATTYWIDRRPPGPAPDSMRRQF